MTFLRILAGPIMGALIGCFTNYIAVKMLFRPLHPVKIGNWTLPFTPGVIPRGQGRIAKALGQMVGDHLVTRSDLEQLLLSDEIKTAVADSFMEKYRKFRENDETIENFAKSHIDPKVYDQKREDLEAFVTGRIVNGIEKMGVGDIIAEEGAKEIRKKVQGPMLSMLVNDELIRSITEPLGKKVDEYIKENGYQKVFPVVVGEVASVESRKISDCMKEIPVEEEKIREYAKEAYVKLVSEKAEELVEKFQISSLVEDKVNKMNVEEIESILMFIMKRELNAVISLGAVIGFILGLITLFL